MRKDLSFFSRFAIIRLSGRLRRSGRLSIANDGENLAMKLKYMPYRLFCMNISSQSASTPAKYVKRAAVLLLLVLTLRPAAANDRYFSYTVETDKTVYRVGDTVYWRVYAEVYGEDVTGISSLSATLFESLNEEMLPPLEENFFVPKVGFVTNCVPLDYFETGIVTSAFNWVDKFDSTGSAGEGWVSMSAGQFVKNEGIFGGEFCESSYVVTKAGFHYLDIIHNSGYAWIDGQDDAEEILDWGRITSTFYVISDEEASPAGINRDNLVNLKDFTSLSNYWLATDCSEENFWCEGADINQDSVVDFLDLTELSDDWLWELELPFE